jgi:hypothetical protein
MFNSQLPAREDLPSTASLLKSTAIALGAAGVLLVTVVLPAEYGIDPTRIGGMLGLTSMGEIKMQLAEEAAADRQIAAEIVPADVPADNSSAAIVPAAESDQAIPEAGSEPVAVVWRETGDGHGVTLIATAAGLAAIGVEPEDANTAPAGATDAPTEEPAPKARTPREGTKQATLIAMLRAPDGATIEEISAALNWASHTVRGAMSGALKKKLGLDVTSEKVEDRGRVYKLPAA